MKTFKLLIGHGSAVNVWEKGNKEYCSFNYSCWFCSTIKNNFINLVGVFVWDDSIIVNLVIYTYTCACYFDLLFVAIVIYVPLQIYRLISFLCNLN